MLFMLQNGYKYLTFRASSSLVGIATEYTIYFPRTYLD